MKEMSNDFVAGTQTLLSLMQSDEDKKEWYLAIDEAAKTLLQHKGSERALVAHQMYEDSFAPYYKRAMASLGREPNCKKGCNYCCYCYVAVMPEEAELLFQLVRARSIQISMKKLRYQAQLRSPEGYWRKFGPKTKCVFLGEDGSCIVYNHRPLSCRGHFAVCDDPEDGCKPAPDGREVINSYMLNLPSEIVVSAALTVVAREGGDLFRNEATGQVTLPTLPYLLLKLMRK